MLLLNFNNYTGLIEKLMNSFDFIGLVILIIITSYGNNDLLK